MGPANLGVFAVICLVFCASGCESQTVTHDQAQSVLVTRMGVRQQLSLTRVQLDMTIASMNDLSEKQADDLVAAYKKYGDEVDALDASVAQLNRASAVSSDQATTYFDTAATKIALIEDPDLKARATSRRQKAMQLAGVIDGDTKTVQLAYQLFVQRLRDIQAYLAADLTSGCVRSIQDELAKTNAEVAPLKARSDQLALDLELGNELMNTGEIRPATTSSTTTSTTTSAPTTLP